MTTLPGVFDIHAHLYHPRWYPAKVNNYLVEDFLRRQKSCPAKDPAQARSTVLRLLSDDTGETTIKIMDKAGIATRVILIIDWGVELGEPEESIEATHREILGICRASGGRLIGFAGIDPRRSSAIELLGRASLDMGAVGLKLHPTGGWSLLDDSNLRLVAAAVELGMVVLVHVGPTMQILSDKHSQPQALVELARRFPQGRFVAGHSGFGLYREFVAMDDVPENLFFDISGWQEWMGDGERQLKERLVGLLESFPGRVCFGTDSPFFTYNLVSQEIRWLSLIRDFNQQASPELQMAASAVLDCPSVLKKTMRLSN